MVDLVGLARGATGRLKWNRFFNKTKDMFAKAGVERDRFLCRRIHGYVPVSRRVMVLAFQPIRGIENVSQVSHLTAGIPGPGLIPSLFGASLDRSASKSELRKCCKSGTTDIIPQIILSWQATAMHGRLCPCFTALLLALATAERRLSDDVLQLDTAQAPSYPVPRPVYRARYAIPDLAAMPESTRNVLSAAEVQALQALQALLRRGNLWT